MVVPVRNEAGTIEELIQRVPAMGKGTEIVAVEGRSTDDTWAILSRMAAAERGRRLALVKQRGCGKADAVRAGLERASGELLFILDADMTVGPEELTKFYQAARSGVGTFVNGTRFRYPMEAGAMRPLNWVANRLFGLAWSVVLRQPVTDALCGTKVFFRSDYLRMKALPGCGGYHDPFGDFALLYGAAVLKLRVVDLPVRYRRRTYGQTNIQRWHDGWLLFKMLCQIAMDSRAWQGRVNQGEIRSCCLDRSGSNTSGSHLS